MPHTSRRIFTFWALAVACLGPAALVGLLLSPVTLAFAGDGGTTIVPLLNQLPAWLDIALRLVALFAAWRVGLCTDWACPNRQRTLPTNDRGLY